LCVVWLRQDIVDMDNVLCPGEAAKWSIRMGVDDGFTLPQLGVGSRGAVVRNMSERTIFVQRHGAEVRLAYAGRVFQHRPEYRLKRARRAADDLEHLRRRSLLLQRLAQLVKQPRVLDGDNCSGKGLKYTCTCPPIRSVSAGAPPR